MASIVDLCNQALSLAGTRSNIQSIDEDSEEAGQCKTWFEPTRDSLLRKGIYAFGRYTLALGELSAGFTLPQNWAYCYAVPSDCIRILTLTRRMIDINSMIPIFSNNMDPQLVIDALVPGERYELSALEDQSQTIIYTNIKPAYLTYCRRITNVNLFDQGFQDALVMVLASRICYPLTAKSVRSRELAASAKQYIDEAEAESANEQQDTNFNDFIPDYIADR